MRSAILLLMMLVAWLASPALAEEEDAANFDAAYDRYKSAMEAKDFAAASTAAKEALQFGKRVLDIDSELIPVLYTNYGSSLLSENRPKEAIKPLSLAIEELERRHGRSHKSLLGPLWTISKAYELSNRKREAKKSYEKISGLIHSSKFDDDLSYAMANMKVGTMLVEFEVFEPGIQHLQSAIDVFELDQEMHRKSIGEAQLSLGVATIRTEGRTSKDALIHFQRAYQNLEGYLSEQHPDLLTAKGYIVFLRSGVSREEVPCINGPEVCVPKPRTEADYRLIERTFPKYPGNAARSKKEGWVTVSFTITREGRTADISVVASDGSGLFDVATRRAARKFRYKPRMQGGEPVDTPNVLNTMTFWLP